MDVCLSNLCQIALNLVLEGHGSSTKFEISEEHQDIE